ncbi:hypothetical protein M885DRAFT_616126 [Pelagophyceae sp. CCMP2097]|nr:hypothetical protein M885DRAFT_616126 [Pelagophyceae sp. CCMP2097]
MPLPTYFNLEWRLDVEVGKRTLLHTADPTFVLRLDTLAAGAKSGAKPVSVAIEADFAHMKHLEARLSEAVAELEDARTARLLKYVR